jgi:hypothetical protein
MLPFLQRQPATSIPPVPSPHPALPTHIQGVNNNHERETEAGGRRREGMGALKIDSNVG